MKAGDTVGPYQILDKLGAGGMGEVYRATDTKLKRQVAIKVLPTAVAEDADRLARFQREAEVLAQLNHPNIAAIHGLEEADGVKALVMELVEGPTLADRLSTLGSRTSAQGSGLPLDEALPIAEQIAQALEAAHEQGIVHRDLKPANIKIRPDGAVKVLDFGLARAMEPASALRDSAGQALSMSPTITTPAMTQAGLILGTAAYMAPEQARGKTVDKRADIWAFGVVLYETLTGERPFKGDDVAEVLAHVITKPPDLARVPAEARRLVDACLQKDPRERLRDIGDAKRLLGATVDVAAAPATGKGPLGWMIGAGVLVLALAGVSFLYVREAPPVQETIGFEIAPPARASIGQFRISPDGRQLVIRASNRLWVRALDSSTLRELAGTEGATYPFWSPDGRDIGFFAAGKLRRIAAAGGPVLTVCDAANGRGGSWGRDGVIVFTPDLSSAIYRVADSGGTPQPVTDAGGGTRDDRFPEFLPDGRRFLFSGLGREPGVTGVYAGSVDGTTPVRVLPDQSNAMYLASAGPDGDGYVFFRRGSTLVVQAFDPARSQVMGDVMPVAENVGVSGNTGYGAFAASARGTLAYVSGVQFSSVSQLVWLDRSGKRLSTVTKPAEVVSPALSPDGHAVAFGVGNTAAGDSAIWLQDMTRNVLSRLTSGSRAAFWPVWSPDGSQILFGSSTGSDFRLELNTATGAGSSQVVLEGETLNTSWPTDWSRDGKLLVYSNRSSKTKDDLWLLPMQGERKALPYLQTEANEAGAKFSPDGSWLAYVSDASGKDEVYVQHVPQNGSRFQISSSGGGNPTWSRDGKELFYLAPNPDGGNPRMMAVPVKVGAAFEPGVSKVLFDDVAIRSIEPSPDGRRFLAEVPAEGEGPVANLSVVVHWQPESAKK